MCSWMMHAPARGEAVARPPLEDMIDLVTGTYSGSSSTHALLYQG